MKKNGFTLVELLAVIVILSILFSIGFYSYTAYVSSAREKTKKIEIAQIINSGAAYHKEMQQNKNYLYYVDKNNVKYSCISIKSLIDMGYYKGNVSFLNEELTKENAVVKIKEVNGVASYEVVAPYVKDQDCVYYDYSNVMDTTTSIGFEEEDKAFSLKTSITRNPNKKNSYILKLKLGSEVYSSLVNLSLPVYVLDVLDVSGSMEDNYKGRHEYKFTRAKNAAIELSKKIINNFDNSQIGLINFSTSVKVSREFKHEILASTDFKKPKGNTNIAEAFDEAAKLIRKIEKTEDGFEPFKYVIFLSDGKPYAPFNNTNACMQTDSSGEVIVIEECKVILRETAKKIKDIDNTILIFIAYGIDEEIFKEVSSVDETGNACPNSSVTFADGKKHCYYNSDSTNIGDLFNNISNTISRYVKNQKYSLSNIYIGFDRNINVYDLEGRKSSNLNLSVDLTKTINDVLTKEYQYIITTDNVSDSVFTCDFDRKICTYKTNLFGSYYVNLYDINGNFSKKVDLFGSPTITITKSLQSYIN